MNKDIKDKLEKLKDVLTEQLTNNLTDDEHDISLDIIDSIPEELQAAFIIIYNKNKNMMVKLKSSQCLFLLTVIDSNIDLLNHLDYLENEKSVKDQTEAIINSLKPTPVTQPVTPSVFSWFTIANIFKGILVFIVLLFTIWTMFIINPVASDKTFGVISNFYKINKGKE